MIEDLIDFAWNEPQSHDDMVEQFMLMTEDEMEDFDEVLIALASARIDAGMRRKLFARKGGVH